MHALILIFTLVALVCQFALAGPVRASQPEVVCERAALLAAAAAGVPPDVLGALTLTETGRRRGGVVRPWPWSVNAEGESNWFDSAAEAVEFAQARIAQGRHNLDIGCFQLNWRWHGRHFASVAQMFEPMANAHYAAAFLGQLHAEMGDWRRAAGAFHSRTPEHATRYLARFDELRATIHARGIEDLTGLSQGVAHPGSTRDPPRSRQTLLGAPLGSRPGQGIGSLAVLAPRRAPVGASAGALVRGAGVAGVFRE